LPAVTRNQSATSNAVRRRRGRGLLVSLLVLVLLLVAADRIGKAVAEAKVADKVQSSQHLNSQPAVHIDGFPFLTQVTANHYRTIRLDANQLTVGSQDKRVALDWLHARLIGVRATNHFSGVTADQVAASAKISYSELSRLLGVPVGYAPGGRVQAKRSVSVLGRTVTGTVSAVITVPGGDELGFADVRVGVADTSVSLPQSAVSELTAVFASQLSLSGLPFGLRVRQIAPDSGGVQVNATASNVALG
jgi:hypothetical protein